MCVHIFKAKIKVFWQYFLHFTYLFRSKKFQKRFFGDFSLLCWYTYVSILGRYQMWNMFFKGEQGLLGLVYKRKPWACQLPTWASQIKNDLHNMRQCMRHWLLASPMIRIIPFNKSKQTVAKYANPLSIMKCIQYSHWLIST